MQVGLIGCGNMGRALARGWRRPLVCSDPIGARARELAAEVSGVALTSNVEVARRCDLLVLAHKPSQLKEVAGEVQNKSVLDAALIAAAQAEHYEMTRYGTLVAWAKQLGRNDAATLLNQTLDEEKATDKKLTEMAESQINRKAA